MLFCLRADVSNKPEEFRDFGQSFKVTQQGKANTYGKRAGYIRNKQMAEYTSEENGVLIAFPIGEARGTKLMIKLAHEYDLETDVYYSLGQ